MAIKDKKGLFGLGDNSKAHSDEISKANRTVRGHMGSWDEYFVELTKYKSDFEELVNIINKVRQDSEDLTPSDMKRFTDELKIEMFSQRGKARRKEVFGQIKEDSGLLLKSLTATSGSQIGIIPNIEKILKMIKNENPEKNVGVTKSLLVDIMNIVKRDLDAQVELVMELLRRTIQFSKEVYEEDQRDLHKVIQELEVMMVDLYQIFKGNIGNFHNSQEASLYKMLDILEILEDLRKYFRDDLTETLYNRKDEKIPTGENQEIKLENLYFMSVNYYRHYHDPIYERARKIRSEIAQRDHGIAGMDEGERLDLEEEWIEKFREFFLKDTVYVKEFDKTKDIDEIKEKLETIKHARKAFDNEIFETFNNGTAQSLDNVILSTHQANDDTLLKWSSKILGGRRTNSVDALRNSYNDGFTIGFLDKVISKIKDKVDSNSLGNAKSDAKKLLEFCEKRYNSIARNRDIRDEFSKDQKAGSFIYKVLYDEKKKDYFGYMTQIKEYFAQYSERVRSAKLTNNVNNLRIFFMGQKRTIGEIFAEIDNGDGDLGKLKNLNQELDTITKTGDMIKYFENVQKDDGNVNIDEDTVDSSNPRNNIDDFDSDDLQMIRDAFEDLIGSGIVFNNDEERGTKVVEIDYPSENEQRIVARKMEEIFGYVIGSSADIDGDGGGYTCPRFEALCMKYRRNTKDGAIANGTWDQFLQLCKNEQFTSQLYQGNKDNVATFLNALGIIIPLSFFLR